MNYYFFQYDILKADVFMKSYLKCIGLALVILVLLTGTSFAQNRPRPSVQLPPATKPAMKPAVKEDAHARPFSFTGNAYDALSRSDLAVVATWQNDKGFWFASGPLQSTIVGWKGEDGEKKAMSEDYMKSVWRPAGSFAVTPRYIGTWNMYRIYSLDYLLPADKVNGEGRIVRRKIGF
jgi:hypothetical protein